MLIAKRCPECGAHIKAKKNITNRGKINLSSKSCSSCLWKSPEK